MLFLNTVVYYLWVICLLFFNEIVADRNTFLKSKTSKIQDLLTHKDLRVYLISLERIIKFSYDFKDDLDLNFSFGLFLVNGKTGLKTLYLT